MSEAGGNDRLRVFICYSRDDRSVVYPEIDWLREQGLDVHVDRHITPGVQWMEAVAEAITSCQLVLFYASENSIRSDYCAQELRFALHQGIGVLTVKISRVELPPWMELALGDHQILERFDMSHRRPQTRTTKNADRNQVQGFHQRFTQPRGPVKLA